MNDPATPPSPDPRKRVGHETSDASPSAIGWFALGLTLMIALVLPLLSWVFWRFEAGARRADALHSAVVGDQTPPPPLLQDHPATDLVQFRREEQRRLSSYGWVDQDLGIVHIPINRAIEILAERGLPEPADPPESPANEERAP